MASSEGLAGVEPWMAEDSFLYSDISWDGDLIARAIQKSIFCSDSGALSQQQVQESSLKPTVSSASGGGGDGESDLENHVRKRKQSAIPVSGCGGKARKRRSRATKRSQTTFINADPANFRHMVQQVTGVRYGVSSDGILAQIVKPEPHRAVSRLPCGPLDRFTLPTPDTQSFSSNHRQESLMAGPAASVTRTPPISSSQQSPAIAAAAVGFDTYSLFPTLESWTVL